MWMSHYSGMGLWPNTQQGFESYKKAIGVVDMVSFKLTHLYPFGLASLAGCPVMFEDVETPEKFYAKNRDNYDEEKKRVVLRLKKDKIPGGAGAAPAPGSGSL